MAPKQHPYLSGNFAPVDREFPLTPCCVAGALPSSLSGGQYIRNGCNPLHLPKDAPERAYHWFDGDGMLSGVLFGEGGEAWFVNKMLVTDVLLGSDKLDRNLLPSIATLVSPDTPTATVLYHILKSFLLCISTHLTSTPLRCLSVANTSILFHSRRALAWCESGPPLEVRLPKLDTIGWQTFERRVHNANGRHIIEAGGLSQGGNSLIGFFTSWTSAHPHIDPVTGEMLLLHPSFLPPYLRYTVLDAFGRSIILSAHISLEVPKMMHDFAATATHTVVMDLPLVFGPANLLKGRPVLYFDRTLSARFGILPRYLQGPTRWFEDEACVIFHTANAWNTFDSDGEERNWEAVDAVNLLCCRFKTDGLVFAAGNLPLPEAVEDPPLLHYYRFPLSATESRLSHSFPLLSIPFEFPALPPQLSTRPARYIFGCSMLRGSFTVALGGASKIDCLVRVDVLALVAQGLSRDPSDHSAVDRRTMPELLASQDINDPVRVFHLPADHYAQEPTFVPLPSFDTSDPETHADGHLLFYVFDERQLLPDGSAPEGAKSELWVLDARDMRTVVAKVRLPGRVPYGLHGSFVSREEIASQRPAGPVRKRPQPESSTSMSGWTLQTSFVRQVFVGKGEKDPVDLLLRLLAMLQCVLGLFLVVSSYVNSEGAIVIHFGLDL